MVLFFGLAFFRRPPLKIFLPTRLFTLCLGETLYQKPRFILNLDSIGLQPRLEIDSEKIETNRYSIKKKVENNAIDYRLPIDSSNHACS